MNEMTHERNKKSLSWRPQFISDFDPSSGTIAQSTNKIYCPQMRVSLQHPQLYTPEI